MLTPSSGSCRVFDIDPTQNPVKLHQMAGVITEHAQMYDHLSGMDNLIFYGIFTDRILLRAPFSGNLLCTVRIFQSYCVRQLIVGKQFSVTVINITPGAAGFNGFFHFIIKVRHVFLSLNNLKYKKTVYQNGKKQGDQNPHYNQSIRKHFQEL